MMKKFKKSHVIAITSILTSVVSLSSVAGVISYAYYERSAKVLDAYDNNIPIATDGYKDTKLYLFPGYENGRGEYMNVPNLYLAICEYKDDDSIFEFQFIRCCDENGDQIAHDAKNNDRIFQYTLGAENFRMFRFEFDLTYYNRIVFMRIALTNSVVPQNLSDKVQLADYMGLTSVVNDERVVDIANAPDYFVSRSTKASHVPLDWRNQDRDWGRYNCTHRLSEPNGKNCYEIKKPDSDGDYGQLSAGDWRDVKVTE